MPMPTQAFKSIAFSLFEILRKSWQIWFPILVLLVGLGILQIDVGRVVVSPQNVGYVSLGLVLLWTIITIVLLSARNHKTQSQLISIQADLVNAQQEILRLQSQAFPVFFIEEIALSSLLAHIQYRQQERKYNPVKLDIFGIECKVVGSDSRKDADVRYHLSGTYIGEQRLTGLYLSLAGDNLVPLEELDVKLYDLKADPQRRTPLRPRLSGADSIRKDLFLPLINPGVGPFEPFEVELNYRWPRIFSPHNGYWFLDNLDFEGATKQIVLSIEFIDLPVDSVRAYSLDMSSKIPDFLGIVQSDPNSTCKFIFKKDDPQRDTYYIVVFEATQ
jgi:hypothetical protein